MRSSIIPQIRGICLCESTPHRISNKINIVPPSKRLEIIPRRLLSTKKNNYRGLEELAEMNIRFCRGSCALALECIDWIIDARAAPGM